MEMEGALDKGDDPQSSPHVFQSTRMNGLLRQINLQMINHQMYSNAIIGCAVSHEMDQNEKESIPTSITRSSLGK